MLSFPFARVQLLILLVLFTTSSSAFSLRQNADTVALAAVEKQLGYVPPNFVKVTSWTSRGEPVAIQTYPLDGGAPRRQRRVSSDVGTPFPTLYWLCHNEIRRAIGDLERTGHVRLLQERLNSNPDDAKSFRQAHDDYARERWLSLTEQDRAAVEEHHDGMTLMLQDSGVSGTDYRCTEVPNIKCLHAHYAHYRSSSGNLVGKWVDELLTEQYPDLDL
jgi:hypothetical protein